MKRPDVLTARTNEQADEGTTVYVAWRAPLETLEQWIESCKPLRARQSRIILPKRASRG